MATLPVGAQSAPANPLLAFDHSPTQLVELLSLLDRQRIEEIAEATIALLDMIDGDPDLEQDWSEDGITDEMSRVLRKAFGPGCEMSDAGEWGY